MCSIYQFMYSYRDSKDSPFPEIKSKNSVNALKKFKEIKEKISSGKFFYFFFLFYIVFYFNSLIVKNLLNYIYIYIVLFNENFKYFFFFKKNYFINIIIYN